MNTRRKSPVYMKSRRRSPKKSLSSSYRSPQYNRKSKKKSINGGGKRRKTPRSRAKSKPMTLQEYHRVEKPLPQPVLSIDRIPYDVYILIEKELSDLNKARIELAKHSYASGGRYPTDKELYESQQSEHDWIADQEWYKKYKDPRLYYENKYREPDDFTLTTKADPYPDNYKRKYYY